MPKKITNEEFMERVKKYTNDSVEVITPYINKKTKVKIKCKKCNYIWDVSPISFMPSSTKDYNFIGCPECKYTELECDFCHKKFKRLKSAVSENYNFCSKICGNRFKNKEFTNWTNSCDYRRNAFNVYPHKCAVCGYNEDERILEVHHIDENRGNNDLSNLIILCPICHKKLTLHLYSLEELQTSLEIYI